MVRAVIFDLDGVIADSSAEITLALQETFAEFGFPRPEREKVLAVESLGSAKIVESLLPPERRGDDALKKAVLERYAKVSVERIGRIKPVAGAKELLRFLRAKGVKAAVATNRGETAHALIRALGLEGMIDAVVASSDVKNLKPHPEPLLLALKRVGVEAGDALFVGDSQADAEAGRAAGIRTVLYGKKCSGCASVGSLLELEGMV